MQDLINRQGAIDALEEPCKVSDTWTDEYAIGERTQWEKDVKTLNSLPSAQPTEASCWRCNCPEMEITMEDVEEYCTKRCLTVITTQLFHEMRARWSQSQPEIIKCKECKHWEHDVIFADGWCRGKHQGNPEWFCADAERRTDERMDV